MVQQNRSSAGEEDQSSRRRWLPLLLLLFFLALITSTIVGFILGRNAGPVPLGQMIDTIVLTPEETAVPTAFHLSGCVRYTDGTPAAGQTLELHSDPITTVTDSKGGFLFPNVPEGDHTVYVLNADGSLGAQREIQVVRGDEHDTVAIDFQEDGKYVIELAVNIRVLEIEIEVGTGELYINPDQYTYATQEGVVTTPAGSASVRDGVIVTSNGNVYLPEGDIVFAGGDKNDPAYIVQKDDTVIVNQPLIAGDIAVAPDGTVALPDGTVIEPGGLIKTPDGEVREPGVNGSMVTEQTVMPIGDHTFQPEDEDPGLEMPSEAAPSVAPAEPEREPAADASAEGGTTGTPKADDSSGTPEPSVPAETPDSGSSGSGPDRPISPDHPVSPDRPVNPDEPDDTPEPVPDQGELKISAQKKDGQFESWLQTSVIDLFYNRSSGETEKIAPGTSGYYLFQLQNTRKMPLTITVSIAEEEGVPYVPLNFTLHPKGQRQGGVSGSLEKGRTLTFQTVISGGSSEVYQLDWEWPYEGNDAADTAAGSQGGQYTLKLTIHAEEEAR